jgi:hypothetical protein
MTDKRKLSILVFAIFMGGLIQALKSFHAKNHLPAHEAIANRQLFEYQPFHIDKSTPSESKNFKRGVLSQKNSSLENKFSQDHTFSVGKKTGNKVDKKAKDPKKKDKKQAKRKKKTVRVAEEKTTNPETQKNPDSENSDGNNKGPQNSGLGGFGGGVSGNETPSDIPQTTEEWLKLMLADADYKLVTKFIDYYNSRMIPTSVFYEVLTVMLEDTREELNAYAVLAAGSTPSQNSFQFLIGAIEAPQLTEKIRSNARDQLSVYKNLQYLNVLKAIVAETEDVSASLLAANLIALSAKKNLVATEPKPGATGSLDTSKIIKESIKRNYEITRDLLNTLMGQSKDANLNSAFTEAIKAIEDSLKS